MAYLLGYAFADGTLIESEASRSCYLRFHSVDRDLLEQVAVALGYRGKILSRKPRDILKGSQKYRSKTCYCISIGSKSLFSDLTKLGLTTRKSLTAQLPEVSNRYFGDFVRGYLDGDGCINISRAGRRLQVIFTSGSKGFLSALSRRLMELLPIEERNVVVSTQSFQLRYSTREANIILAFVYKNVAKNPHLKRKYLLYRKWRGTQVA